MRDLYVRYSDGTSKLFTDVTSYGEIEGMYLIVKNNNATTRIPCESIRDVRVYD